MNFVNFKSAVAKQFESMHPHGLFRVELDKDKLYAAYLSAFPAGTNELYRERLAHDCSACKSFIRAVGNAVSLIDNKVVSIWDVVIKDEPEYQQVADAMSAFVKALPITDVFLHGEHTAGVDKNFEEILGEIKTWNHFFVNVPTKFYRERSEIPEAVAKPRESKQVFKRGVLEIDPDAIEVVLECIGQNSIYRGADYKGQLTEFQKLHRQGRAMSESDLDLFAWKTATAGTSEAVLRTKNTAIGVLLDYLTSGIDLETAVKKFETSIMAPESYKRPTALVSKKQIEAAKVTVEALGLTSALQRRYTVLSDVSVNDILFVDRKAKPLLANSVFDDLAAETSAKVDVKKLNRVEEITIDEFLTNVLPHAKELEVLFENRHVPRLVSLVGPQDPTAGRLFYWDNRYSWSYYGELADSSMRQQVAAKGGRVDGAFRFTHSWNYDKRNASLMDLHVFMPGSSVTPESGSHDSYGSNDERVGWNNRNHPRSGGIQDVDYTAAAPAGYVPVENISWADVNKMPQGRYICKVHNWRLREPTQGGFKAEIEFGGEIFEYEYDKPLGHKQWITVAEVMLEGGKFSILKHHLPEKASTRTVWNVPTQTFHKVNVVMLSPNYWSGLQQGNKHFMFMLDGCVNDGPARGFYNEQLMPELTQHRKVLEMVGSKLQLADAEHQLSGLGFSSTQKDTMVVRVKGSFERMLKIVF